MTTLCGGAGLLEHTKVHDEYWKCYRQGYKSRYILPKTMCRGDCLSQRYHQAPHLGTRSYKCLYDRKSPDMSSIAETNPDLHVRPSIMPHQELLSTTKKVAVYSVIDARDQATKISCIPCRQELYELFRSSEITLGGSPLPPPPPPDMWTHLP